MNRSTDKEYKRKNKFDVEKEEVEVDRLPCEGPQDSCDSLNSQSKKKKKKSIDASVLSNCV